MRICSLLPSATEIVCALGLEDSLVGISHECDYPASVRRKPALIRPRVDPASPPAVIDSQVRELMSRGESLYSVDAELLFRLSPDLIITQDLCHVCAASPDDLATALARQSSAPRVLTLSADSLREVWNDVCAVGDATGSRPRADELVRQWETRVTRLAQICASAGAVKKPRAVCLEWLSPLYCAGHWVPEMVALVGGEDMLGRPGQPSFRVTWDQVLHARPEILLLMPCGYGVEKAAREFAGLPLPEGWADLPAVRDGRVFAVDANGYFSRPGPRLVEGLELLAHLLWPGLPLSGLEGLSLPLVA